MTSISHGQRRDVNVDAQNLSRVIRDFIDLFLLQSTRATAHVLLVVDNTISWNTY